MFQLIGGLADEKERWKESVEKLDSIINNYVGDVMISAGYVAYLGPFTVRICWSQTTCTSPYTCNKCVLIKSMNLIDTG